MKHDTWNSKESHDLLKKKKKMLGEVKLPNKLVFHPKFSTINNDGSAAYSSITPQSAIDYGKDNVLDIAKKE